MAYKTYTCPISRTCGGCELLAVPYPIQLRRKAAYVEGLLGEMASSDGARIEPARGMDEPLAFRHKAATPFAPGGKGGRRVRCGLYAAGTHRIVRCERCLVEVPEARPLFEALARAAERLGVSAYDEDRGRGCLRHAILRRAHKGGESLLTLVTNGEHIVHEQEFLKAARTVMPSLTSVVLNVNQRRTNAMLGPRSRTLVGPGVMHDELLGCTFEIGPASFYQTNPAQTEVLYQTAIDAAMPEGGSAHVLDAYCGTGTIGICLASQMPSARVTGVEKGPEAARLARRNARANGLADRCEFVCADATAWMTSRRNEGFDVVLLDPPRAGSTPEFLRAAAALAPARVVYVSCNPETQARDVALLRNLGYRLELLVPVDMFPHTKHVETVASLVRR